MLGWDKVCMPIANGSLGIRKFTTFNKALLGKWLWHFEVEETQLWRRVVVLKFGEEFFFGGEGWGWTSKLGGGVYGCGFVEKYSDGLGCFYQKHIV